jgi:glycosyltransferase involved in cell wall biosynthesis
MAGVSIGIKKKPRLKSEDIRRMDERNEDLSAETRSAKASSPITAPLVSIVIVNHNYQTFVSDAIRSAQRQSYRPFECLVLDNGSSDDSATIIEGLIAGDGRFAFHRIPENRGHLGAALYALDHIRGEFVIFLDADDILFDSCLDFHVQAHLAARHPTGLSSSACVEISAIGQALLMGSFWISDICEWLPPDLAPSSSVPRLAHVTGEDYARLAQATRWAGREISGWIWGAGSSNMFRRSILDLLRPGGGASVIFGGVDGYYAPLAHAVAGTLLINTPLYGYRIHGDNDYKTLPSLVGVDGGKQDAKFRANAMLRLGLLTVIERAGAEHPLVNRSSFWRFLDIVAGARTHGASPYRHAEIRAALIERYQKLQEPFGRRVLIKRLRQRMSLSDCARIIMAGERKGRLAAALLRLLLTDASARAKSILSKINRPSAPSLG